jgi:hypothetical protein
MQHITVSSCSIVVHEVWRNELVETDDEVEAER